ncbi:MAG TPA: hypothetical protein VJW17_15780 [Pyrinomonadaceae bacterium]|nr:hypothetical protein [Pyrinomonadaceae bacterium]
MKRLLTLTLLISSLGLVGSAQAAAKEMAAAFNNSPQIRVQIGQRRRYRDRDRWRYRNQAYGDRVGYGRTFTRDVQYGRRVYRETYQVRDGRTFLISRVRLY